MGIQKTPSQKTYEMSIESQSFHLGFLGSNREFDWLGICLVLNKSGKHSTIYDSYNVKKAAQFIKSAELENISEAYSLTNQKNMTSLMTHKNTSFKNNLSPGIVTVVQLLH